MKKSKLVLIMLVLMGSICILSGCTNTEEKKDDSNQNGNESSIAATIANQFKDEIAKEKDIESVATSLSQNEVLQIKLDVALVNEGDYISGFQTEIKGFKKAVVMRPFIGTIPFLAYIFEVKDAEAFSENLKTNADLRWNICTEADDMETAVVDNYVFFIMAPQSFEE